MWKWISRLLSPKNPSAAHPLPPVELAALVDLNMLDLNLAEARALLQQDGPLPAAIRQRLETFSLAANALASQVPSPGRRSTHWGTLRRSARHHITTPVNASRQRVMPSISIHSHSPSLPKNASQSISPGLSWEMAVRPRSAQERAPRQP